jgi:hypothetical protein
MVVQRICPYCHKVRKQTKIRVRTTCQCQIPGGGAPTNA